MKRNKIFFVAPCLSMGGMERAAVNTANGLAELGNQVIFLSLFKKEHFFKLNDSIKILEPNGFNQNNLNIIKSIPWIRAEIKKNTPDIVLAFNKFYGALTALALVGVDIPFYLSERSSPLYKWRFPFNIINRFSYLIKPPTGVIAQTQLAASFQKKYYPRSDIKVIPNSVRHVKLYPEVKRERVILAVGRLNDYLKGFDLLLESFALLNNKDWELHIAGGDEDGEALKRQAADLGVLNRVKFLGKVKEIDKCYAYAGIYVIPSRSEGFPNALAEAMAAGCCCVAFDFIAGPSDLITNGVNGFLVPPSNTQLLSEQLDRLIEAKTMREKVGLASLANRERFDLIKIVSEINQFIDCA